MIGAVFGSMGGSSIAVDIGTNAIKILEIANVKKDPKVVNFVSAPLPPDTIVDGTINDVALISDVLKGLLKKSKIRGRRVVTSISGRSAIVKNIRMQRMDEEQLREQIQWEAENYIPFEISDVNLSFQILDDGGVSGGSENSNMSVLLVAAKKETVNQHVEILTSAGLEPDVIDVDTFAMFNAYDFNYGFEAEENIALVNIGASVTNINIVRGGTPFFTRDVSMGGNAITRDIQKSLNLQFEQAEKMKIEGEEIDLIKTTGEENMETGTPMVEIHPSVAATMAELTNEINLSFDWFKANAQGETIGKIAMFGGTALLKNLDAYFSQTFKVRSEVVNPLSRIKTKQADLSNIAPLLGVSVGLALRKLG